MEREISVGEDVQMVDDGSCNDVSGETKEKQVAYK